MERRLNAPTAPPQPSGLTQAPARTPSHPPCAITQERLLQTGGTLSESAQSVSGMRLGQAMSSYRTKAQAWYSSRRWKAKRLAQLRAEPLCAYCAKQGKVTPARIADHVIPHKGDEGMFWNGKLASLCKPCHDSVKKREEAGAPVLTYGLDGWPIA